MTTKLKKRFPIKRNPGSYLLGYKNHFEKLEQIKKGKLSLRQNIDEFLSAIHHNKDLNSFISVFDDAINEATVVEDKIKSGSHGILAGMVVAVKDVIAVKDRPLTCSSNILKNFQSIYSATAVRKLIEEDAIIIGKTNCDEFAMGSSNENSAFGPVLNPNDKSRVPGGSSGGSAVAVAANLCDTSLGTDTGGSIRQPASFCGMCGLKPTYGRVSRFGLTAFASSFDSIGPFTRSIEDAALVLSVIAGHDEMDSTSTREKVDNYPKLLLSDRRLKIGIPKEYFGDGIDSQVRNRLTEVIEKLKSTNVEIIDIELPTNEFSIATYYILTTAEASSNLARYDGVRYTNRNENYKDLIDMYTHTRTNDFGSEVKRRIMLGTYVLSAGYYDAYYKKAQKVRRLIKEDFDRAFKEVDIILTPTSPFTAFKIGEKKDDPLQMYLSDIFTTSANLAGIPGLSIPVGNDSNGLPIGLQLLANQFEERTLLEMGYRIQNLLQS